MRRPRERWKPPGHFGSAQPVVNADSVFGAPAVATDCSAAVSREVAQVRIECRVCGRHSYCFVETISQSNDFIMPHHRRGVIFIERPLTRTRVPSGAPYAAPDGARDFRVMISSTKRSHLRRCFQRECFLQSNMPVSHSGGRSGPRIQSRNRRQDGKPALQVSTTRPAPVVDNKCHQNLTWIDPVSISCTNCWSATHLAPCWAVPANTWGKRGLRPNRTVIIVEVYQARAFP
jgi:hypothetical protein